MDEEKEKEELKPEHKIFCEEVVIDWNQTRAYMVAYPSSKESSARANASRLIANDNIQAYIEEYQKNLSKATGVTAIRNIMALAQVAYTNVSDLKDDWETNKDWSTLTEDQKAAISEITVSKTEFEGGEKTTVKVKVHDKIKAIMTLNKMLGFEIAEPEKGGGNTGSLTINIGTNGIKELPSHEDDIIDFTENE
jgi:phage terminase small subunit